MKNPVLAIILFVLLLSSCRRGENGETGTAGVRQSRICLDGPWYYSREASEAFRMKEGDIKTWAEIRVPGEPAMQGFKVQHDKPAWYVKFVRIPDDFKDRKILLRFDGVYSYARLWVNGQLVRDHKGGFTRWYGDITSWVSPGERAMVALEVTDKMDDISYASGYAKHPIGGILRSVFLEAGPKNGLEYWNVDTDLDTGYKNATLRIRLKACIEDQGSMEVGFKLFDPAGKEVPLQGDRLVVSAREPEITHEFTIENPLKWEAEHPFLYTVKCVLRSRGEWIWTGIKRIGFREVEVKGRQLLVNGRPVKLRGACRHDIHPLLGRVGTRYYDSLDVVLAKEANINFIRTSHYPPTEDFVSFCDRAGIYVECESAVCFVDTHRSGKYAPGASENDPAFRAQYVSQIEEMVSVFRDHPSVIIWSLGNESRFGTNFEASASRLKELEPVRPVIFSYPGHVSGPQGVYDILSMHYPDSKGNLLQYGKQTKAFTAAEDIPVLFDEWAHVACYNRATLKEDPNVRSFWGMSLDRMWGRCFFSRGGLGGAIWGFVDETFMLPDTCTGYGEWGIIDTWRRKKPEFWNAKKAYSPFKLPLRYIDSYKPWKPLSMPLVNRFDHTNLKEITVKWDVGSQYGVVDTATLDIPPHTMGQLVLPAREWKEGEVVRIEAIKDGLVIDRYDIPLGAPPSSAPGLAGMGRESDLVLEEDGDDFTVTGAGFSVTASSKDGRIREVVAGHDRIIASGPFLQFRGKLKKGQGWGPVKDLTGAWDPGHVDMESYGDSVVWTVDGRSGTLPVHWRIRIDRYGFAEINYTVSGFGPVWVRELGLGWQLAEGYDSLEWKRRAYWSYYPEDHPGRPEGKAALVSEPSPPGYRMRPVKGWPMDTRDYFLFGKESPGSFTGMSNMVKGMKETVYFYRLTGAGRSKKLTVLSGGMAGCRIQQIKGGDQRLIVDNLWDYPDLGWGNYMREVKIKEEYKGRVTLYIGRGRVDD